MRRGYYFWAVALLAIAAAFTHAWALRWSCDDAYISYRYAQHFVEGHGLVFNLDPGEAPVEGYSNFSWTMWLAVGMWLGFTGDAIETWSALWGSLLHAGTAALLALMSWRASRGRAVAPVAACVWAMFHHAASLAPAGLETALFVFLTTAICWLAIEHRRCERKLRLLAALTVLAAMTRPDGALWCVVAGGVVLHDAVRSRAVRDVWTYALPILLMLLPYLLWRRLYYGHWVPNTFFAKSGDDPSLGLGLHYVYECARAYALVVVPAVLALLALPFRRGGLFAAVDPWAGPRAGVILLAFVVPYLAFVVWVGGDFMFWRFLLPVLPLCLLAVDVLLKERVAGRGWALSATAALCAAALLRQSPDYLTKGDAPISDNRLLTTGRVFPEHELTWAEAFRGAGHYLRELFDGLDVHLGIAGSHANVAYRSRVPVAIETAAGLTDAYIAHLPLPPGVGDVKRGHGRPFWLYPGYLERRGVHFMLDTNYARNNGADPYRDVLFPASLRSLVPIPARLVVYDRALMQELKRRDPALSFVDFEAVLDEYLADMGAKDRAQVAADFTAFREFYFDHNDDAPRRARFEDYLAGR